MDSDLSGPYKCCFKHISIYIQVHGKKIRGEFKLMIKNQREGHGTKIVDNEKTKQKTTKIFVQSFFSC